MFEYETGVGFMPYICLFKSNFCRFLRSYLIRRPASIESTVFANANLRRICVRLVTVTRDEALVCSMCSVAH